MKNPANILTFDARQSVAMMLPPFEKELASISDTKTHLLTLRFTSGNADVLSIAPIECSANEQNQQYEIMKTSIKLFQVLSLVILGLAASSFILIDIPENDSATKEEALKEIKEIRKNASYHTSAIKTIENYAAQSSGNFENFVVYARLASTVGYHTMMYVSLAEKTATLQTENSLLIKLAEIVEVPTIGLDRFDELMNAAIQAKTEEDRNTVLKRIDEIKAEKLN